MRVICTAGHVDHGKTTLVAALTGQQPDRLAEEQRRGLTIDLGFAWTSVVSADGDQVDIAFVDLPGHERFVPTMLAGAGPVGTALFVVAADEGWMPQSAEHLAILELLGISQVVVALSRSDLVDDETVEIAQELLADQLAGTILADAPIVAVSAVTGAGLDDLRDALTTCVAATPDAPDRQRPRLWVDRSFTVHGAGTVVTGTLSGGAIRVGQDLVVQPRGTAVRVRGLQSLEQTAPVVHPGWRVAINLVGVTADEVGRGDAVVGGDWMTSAVADVWCRPVDGHTIGRRGAWTVHVGSAAVPAAVFPISGVDQTDPGPVRVEMARPLTLAVGDRVVLREAGRGITAGGGVILDPAPGPRVRGARARNDRLHRLAAPADLTTPGDRLATVMAARQVSERSPALAAADCAATDIAATEGVVDLGSHLVSADVWATWSRLALAAVAGAHQDRPLLQAIDRSVPRSRLATVGADEAVGQAVLNRLVSDGDLDSRPGGVAIPAHHPRLTVAQQAARTALLDALEDAGLRPPPLRKAAEDAQADDDLVDALTREGQLIPLPGLGASLSRPTLDRAIATLTVLQDIEGPFTASQARAALDTSRKFALPLLEVLDQTGLTRRDGDLRHLVH